MKWKKMTFIGIALVAVGTVCTALALSNDSQLWKNAFFSLQLNPHTHMQTVVVDEPEDDMKIENSAGKPKDLEEETTSSIVQSASNYVVRPQSDCSSIDIDANVGDIIFKTGDQMRIDLVFDNPDDSDAVEITEQIVDGTWKVDLHLREDGIFGTHIGTSGLDQAIVTLPENIHSIKADADLGSVVFEEVHAARVDVECNAGNVEMHDCTFDMLKADLDLGSLQLMTLHAGDAEIEMNAGSLGAYDIAIDSSFKAELDLGQADVQIDGQMHDYNLNLKADLGEINVEDERVSASGTYRNNAGENKPIIEIKASLGQINLSFER